MMMHRSLVPEVLKGKRFQAINAVLLTQRVDLGM
jgi:hypothetical protein